MDYQSLLTGKDAATEAVVNRRWWLAPKAERAQSVIAVVNTLAKADTVRQAQYQTSCLLYGNMSLIGLVGMAFAKAAGNIQNSLKGRVSYNVIQSAIDTITSKIAKNKPRPLFLTSGGDWGKKRKAQKLDKFVDGVFYHNDAYALGTQVFRDGCVFGDGLVHVFAQDGQVKFERVIPGEILIDWAESVYGEPRQKHRVKNIDRDVLIDMFPGKKNIILQANSASASLAGTQENIADQVTVVESWHLPSGKDATDGIHTINIDKGNLFEEEWSKDFFPFARFFWSKRMFGYWSQGLAEQIQNIQLEINKLLWVIQRSMHLAGTFKIWMQNGSKIVKEHLNNDIGAIISSDAEPKYLVPPIVPPEVYNHLQTLKNAAFEQAGISQLSAASVKPAGLDSGKALREYNDIESDRFMTIGQGYERFYMELAKLTVDTAKDLFEEDKDFAVTVPGKKFIETIPWKDVDLEEDEYVMKVFPVSSLPNEPAGRLQTIQEYMQAGMLSPRAGKRLLDFPDLEQVEDLQNAQEDYLNKILEEMVDDGIYTAPDPQDDLVLAEQLAIEYFAQGKLHGLDPGKLDLLLTFTTQVRALKAKATAPVPTAGPGAPQAVPAAPPVSEMLPNVPAGVA